MASSAISPRSSAREVWARPCWRSPWALHALTQGHGKAALAAYFLGQEARVAKGLRVALSAALLHVLSGFAVFLALRFIVKVDGLWPPHGNRLQTNGRAKMRNIISIALLAGFMAAVALPVLAHHECRSGEV